MLEDEKQSQNLECVCTDKLHVCVIPTGWVWESLLLLLFCLSQLQKKTLFRMTNIARFCESHLRELLRESELQTSIARQFFTSCANQNKLVSGILGAGGQKIHQLRKTS